MNGYFKQLISNYQNIVFVLLLPLVGNLFLNIYKGDFFFGFQNSSSMMELINFILAGLIFLIYYFLGLEFKRFLKTNFLTTSIVIVWIGIFFLDNIFSFFPLGFSFKSYLTTVSIFVLFLLKNRGSKYINLLRIVTLVLLVRVVFYILNLEFENLFLEQANLYTSDEDRLWYPAVSEIFNTNYRNVLTNNPYPGYGLLTAYIGSINSFLLLGDVSFKYYLAINYLFIFLFFTFLYEISEKKKTFVFMSILFSTVLLTSHWFTYVFFGSLLSEGISSFSFGVLLTELIRNKNLSSNKQISSLIYISFGFLYYTRQFLSTLVLLFVIYRLILFKNKYIALGFIGFLIKILQSYFLPNTYLDPYITTEELSEISFNLNNVLKMVQQFLLDKPISYLILIFLLFVILRQKNQKKYFEFYLLILINTILVTLLMVFLWQKSDVQSSYRYLMTIFYLLLYPWSGILDDFFIKEKYE